ncbi:MAG: 4-hydroxy-tetrahydrodipicolinate synthase, partial [Clostridia bacterium]|nr:4-hydroxy-tetrahydrodipicolinate synthase [Clostridia bacterium]
AEKLGADALLMVTPYYNKASQLGLVKHYTKMADSVSLPIILYNVPGRTATNLLPATVKELTAHPNIVAIKEASDNVSQVSQVAALCGDDIDIYSGCDDLIVPILSVGGKGVISVLSNVMPQTAHDICAKYFEGDVKGSRDLQLGVFDLCKSLFCDVNPIPVKTALNLMGFNVGPCRLPLCEMSEGPLNQLKASLSAHGLI